MENQEEKSLVEQEEKIPARRMSGGEKGPAGFDEVDESTEIIMPRVAVLQGLSQMVTDEKGVMGDIANSLTKVNYGKSLEFIPLFLFKTRVRFEPGQGLVMMSRDNMLVTMAKNCTVDNKDVNLEQYIGKSVDSVPGNDWDGTTPPTFHIVYNFPVLPINALMEFPLCMSMMRTAAKEAKKFISMARTANEDFFARVYKLTTRKETNEKGTFAVPVIELVRRATDEEYDTAYKQYKILYERKEDLSVDLEEEPLAEKHSDLDE